MQQLKQLKQQYKVSTQKLKVTPTIVVTIVYELLQRWEECEVLLSILSDTNRRR